MLVSDESHKNSQKATVAYEQNSLVFMLFMHVFQFSDKDLDSLQHFVLSLDCFTCEPATVLALERHAIQVKVGAKLKHLLTSEARLALATVMAATFLVRVQLDFDRQ